MSVSVNNNGNQNSNHTARTLAKVGLTAGLCAIPILSYPADAGRAINKIRKLEKVPMKDAFVKFTENTGNELKGWFGSLNKFSSKKIGAVAVTAGVICDVLFNMWLANGIVNFFSGKNFNKNK